MRHCEQPSANLSKVGLWEGTVKTTLNFTSFLSFFGWRGELGDSMKGSVCYYYYYYITGVRLFGSLSSSVAVKHFLTKRLVFEPELTPQAPSPSPSPPSSHTGVREDAPPLACPLSVARAASFKPPPPPPAAAARTACPHSPSR